MLSKYGILCEVIAEGSFTKVAEHFGYAAYDAICTVPSIGLTDLFISVDLRDQNGDMLLIRIMKQDIKRSVVVQAGQRIVHGFISKVVTPRTFCFRKYIRSTRPVIL